MDMIIPVNYKSKPSSKSQMEKISYVSPNQFN